MCGRLTSPSSASHRPSVSKSQGRALLPPQPMPGGCHPLPPLWHNWTGDEHRQQCWHVGRLRAPHPDQAGLPTGFYSGCPWTPMCISHSVCGFRRSYTTNCSLSGSHTSLAFTTCTSVSEMAGFPNFHNFRFHFDDTKQNDRQPETIGVGGMCSDLLTDRNLLEVDG